jgi:CRP-like cAMP-binding protein
MEKNAALAALVKRLSATAALTEEDRHALEALPLRIERKGPNETIVSSGDRPSFCCMVVNGFVIRSKAVADGRRQILAFHQPGDVPDLQSLYLHVLDHELSTMSECVLGFIPHAALRNMITSRPLLAEVLWRDTLIDAAIFREWICNVGQRSGISRMAHLILEIYTRLKTIGAAKDGSFRFPVTQLQLGQAIGMSSVHVNRILQELRAEGLLQIGHSEVVIYDERKLQEVADFDQLYLHLDPAL